MCEPSALADWLGAALSFPLRPGAGGVVRDRSGTRHALVERVEPSERLLFHWWPARYTDDPSSTASTVDITLGDAPGGTRVTVTETALTDRAATARLRAVAGGGGPAG